MSKLDLIILKLSSKCNLNCKYCYIYNTGYINSLKNQPKVMSYESINNISIQLRKIRNLFKNTIIALHGGEPLLLGKKKLKYLLCSIRDNCEFPLTIQTNGSLLDNEFLDILYEYNCHIGISLDGNINVNNKYRVDHKNQGTYEKVVKSLNILNDHPAQELLSIIIGVIDPHSCPIECYESIKKFNPKMVDFLFKDGCYDNLPDGKSDISNISYGKWLTELAKYYIYQENPIPIRKIDCLIEDYTRYKLGIPIESLFGMLVINPDGSVTKNELYDITSMSSSFKHSYNINKDDIVDILLTDEYIDYTSDIVPKSLVCKKCNHLLYCNGGSEIHARWSNLNGLNNPSIFCEDYKFFFENLDNIMTYHLNKL